MDPCDNFQNNGALGRRYIWGGDTMCAWCNKIMKSGATIIICDKKKFNGYILKPVSRVLYKYNIPIGVSLLLREFLILPKNINDGYYCTNCTTSVYVTKYGRTSKAPRNDIISTVSGSGFSGCDHYDFSYDGLDKEIFDINYRKGSDLKNFIITDEELTSQTAIMDNFEEKESELSDYESDCDSCDSYDSSDFNYRCWLHSDDED